VLQCVAVCCSVLQIVIVRCVCCSVLQCGSVLQCVAVYCSKSQCVTGRYRSLHCVALCCGVLIFRLAYAEEIGAIYTQVCCSVLQCVAVCCSVLQCAACHNSL